LYSHIFKYLQEIYGKIGKNAVGIRKIPARRDIGQGVRDSVFLFF
jgi:hypothetical protein